MEPERHLRTSNGQRLLLTPPQNLGFGVHVDRQVMRLGFLEAAELSREIEPPSMYEEEGLGQGKGESSPFDRKVIHEEFRVRLSDPTCLVKGSVKIEGESLSRRQQGMAWISHVTLWLFHGTAWLS